MTHEPAAWGTASGTSMTGGVRCSCGWSMVTHAGHRGGEDRLGLGAVWVRYREHWVAMSPGATRRPVLELVSTEQVPLFDPAPYERRGYW